MSFDFSWLFDPVYRGWLLEGVFTTVLISLIGSLVMVVVGLIGASLLHFRVPVVTPVITIFVEFFRNTPTLVQLFFLYFMLPAAGLNLTDPLTGRAVPLFTGFTCVIISLGLHNGAIAIEIIRSGLLGVPRSTVEGARALGYSRLQIYRYVELPLGLRLCIPTMTSNVVSLIKTSAVASMIAVADTMYYANQIMLNSFQNVEIMAVVWLIYVLIAGVVALFARQIVRMARIPGFGS